MTDKLEGTTIHNETTVKQRIKALKRLAGTAFVVAAVAFAASGFGSWSDDIGFSSNRDFYFHIRHPIRAALLSVVFWSGLAIAGIAGLAWAFLSHRLGNGRGKGEK